MGGFTSCQNNIGCLSIKCSQTDRAVHLNSILLFSWLVLFEGSISRCLPLVVLKLIIQSRRMQVPYCLWMAVRCVNVDECYTSIDMCL